MRIASLLPSATEIVCALGLSEQLVAVTHECDWPPLARDKPRVTHTRLPADASSREIDRLVREQRCGGQAIYSLDDEALAALGPDLIITQTLCDVCAVDDAEVRQFVQRMQRRSADRAPRVLYLEPTTLEEVLDSILQVARAAGVPDAGRRLVLSLRQRIERVRATATQLARGPERGSHGTGERVRIDAPLAAGSGGAKFRPPVVVLEWLDPPFSCGHWTPELVEIAGGREPLARAGERSRRLTHDEIAAADPDVLLIACCGFTVERAMQDLPAFLAAPKLASLGCVRQRRVYVTDGSAYFSRPGPRLVDSLEILAHALSPVHELPEGVPAALRVM